MIGSLLPLVVIITLSTGVHSYQQDLVTELPGVSFDVSFRHYSGYLNATEGRRLHYWFVESERSPKDDPLVLWLNGGPGCSSLAGFLTEQGPFRVNKSDSRSLYINEYRWNQVANVIFLESPAGVGFSYRENSDDYTTDDDQTALDNHEAIKSFFQKFPQFKDNQFFVTGESYAGIYVPTLSVRLLTKSPDINFQVSFDYDDVMMMISNLKVYHVELTDAGFRYRKRLSGSTEVG